MPKSKEINVRCSSCGYGWKYTGELWYCTCPRCNSKTMSPLNADYDKDHERNTEEPQTA